jgi:antitoxin CptB|tara:strand:+ start:2804 stop:3061 length:258 start_codon:yes stop_codon:yes gene_type:complete
MAKDIELLKKKIIYRSSYRGTKELDIILRSFVKKYINNLPIKDLKDLFDFLNNNDEDIFKFKQGLKENNKIKNNNISNLFKNFSL